jgi:glucose 1-dehydrogenase
MNGVRAVEAQVLDAARPLEGQAAIVTGGSRGIGAAVCLAFARAGAAVGVNYRMRGDEAEVLAHRIRGEGGRALAIKADVSSEKEVSEMFDRFAVEAGRLDIVVANAGVQDDAPAEDMTLEAWEKVLQVNLTGQFLCARQAIRRFLAQPPSTTSRALGKVICMSSVHEMIPWAGHVNYVASKGGVMMMMKTLAQEVAGRRIRVNGIAPGAIETEVNRKTWSQAEEREDLLKLIPYGRIGTPDDVARAAVWLASDDSDYVTGTTLFVDGGMSLYPGFIGGG